MRPAPTLLVAVALVLAPGSGCSGDDGDGSTAGPDRSTRSSVEELDEPASTTTTPAQGEDGIGSAEDAAAFLVTSWFDGDRDRAMRHAEAKAVDSLFAEEAPEVESVEFISCDTSDLERFDCFFAVEGRPLIVEVDGLRATRVDFDSD